MNESSTPSEQDKPLERRVKSVNFADQALYDFAMQRADNLYGGNFTGYVTALIERDRSMAESRRTLHDLEARILKIIEPYGGRLAEEGDPFDFEVRDLQVVIEARSRFPRERHLEYQLLNAMQKVAFTSPLTRIVVTFPPDLAEPEKERFRQFETAGIENLRACDLDELKKFLESLADPATEDLEDVLLDQENNGAPQQTPDTNIPS